MCIKVYGKLVLECSREIGNCSDPYVVAVVKGSLLAMSRTRFHRLAPPVQCVCNLNTD